MAGRISTPGARCAKTRRVLARGKSHDQADRSPHHRPEFAADARPHARTVARTGGATRARPARAGRRRSGPGRAAALDLQGAARPIAAHRESAAEALQAGRARCGVGAEYPGVGDVRVRLRLRRPDPRHGKSCLQAGRGRICPEAVARGRHPRDQQLPRQPDACDRATGREELPRAARGDLLRRLGKISCLGRWFKRAAAGGPPDGPGDDPVHLRHHGLPEGRAAASSRPRQQWRRHLRPHGRPGRRCLDHHHAAVPHRRLRLLRAWRGVARRNAGAGRGVRAGTGA